MKDKRITGKIIKLSPEGWGFITSIEMKFTRIFFHWTALDKSAPSFETLTKGMNVSFIPVKWEDKGWRAIKIEVISQEVKSASRVDIN